MADKIAPGVTRESNLPSEGSVEQMQAEVDAAGYRKKQDDAKWYIVMGIAFLFMASFSIYIAAGGVAMAGYGLLRYVYFGQKANAAYDPWQDPELDAWEDAELAVGDERDEQQP